MGELDDLLDQVYSNEQAAAKRLADGLIEHEAWQDFEHQLKLAALAVGKEAVQDALPFVLLAMKVAIAAA